MLVAIAAAAIAGHDRSLAVAQPAPAAVGSGQRRANGDGDRARTDAGGGRDAALARRRYRGLWPFYSRETYENGTVRDSAIFSAYRAQSSPNGDYAYRLFPFYSVWREQQGQHTGLVLYPLLYFRDRTPDSYSDLVPPLFARWGRDSARHLLLWPLFHAASDSSGEARPFSALFRWIPTLYRIGLQGASTRHRFGLPFLLDLFQASRSPERTAWSLGAFFAWGQETRSGLALGHYESREGDGWNSHLFPFYFAGADKTGESKFDSYVQTPLAGVWRAGERTHVVLPALLSWWRTEPDAYDATALWPFVRWARDSRRLHRRILPFYYYDESDKRTSHFLPLFYGRVDNPARECTDHYVPLLLTRVRNCADRTATDVLFPLFHSSGGPQGDSGFRLLPFFERYVSERREGIAIGSVLYRRYAFRDPARVSHWILAGLVHWARSEGGARSWALPFYAWKQSLSDTYRSWRAFVLPLLYLKNNDRLNEKDEWVAAGRTRVFWPIAGYSYRASFRYVESAVPQPKIVKDSRRGTVAEVLRERRAYSVLSPFIEAATTRSPAGRLIRREVHAPWPLVKYSVYRETDADSVTRFRIWPLVFTGEDKLRRYYRLYPLLSVESGPAAKHDFWTGTSIFQYHQRTDSTIFRVFPVLFSYERDDPSLRVAGPLWLAYYSSAPEESWFHFLPVAFLQARDDFTRGGLFPLFYNESFGDEPIRYRRPARFLFLWNRLHGGSEWHHSLLWKAISYTGNAGGDFDFRILHRFLVTRSTHGQTEVVLNPVFGYFSDAVTGERSFSILKFLYRYDVEKGEATHRFLFIPFWWSRVESEVETEDQET